MLTREEKMDCCERMIESIIAYNTRDEEKIFNNEYMKSYIASLGEDVVKRLIHKVNGRIAYIVENSYIDSEGLSYNSIVYK